LYAHSINFDATHIIVIPILYPAFPKPISYFIHWKKKKNFPLPLIIYNAHHLTNKTATYLGFHTFISKHKQYTV